MNNTIYKYQLLVTGRQAVPLPKGAAILCAQAQGDQLCLWAAVDNAERSIEPRTIHVIGTGHPVADIGQLIYLSTVQMMGGRLVWHIFTERP